MVRQNKCKSSLPPAHKPVYLFAFNQILKTFTEKCTVKMLQPDKKSVKELLEQQYMK
jgi:hypothetical protein